MVRGIISWLSNSLRQIWGSWFHTDLIYIQQQNRHSRRRVWPVLEGIETGEGAQLFVLKQPRYACYPVEMSSAPLRSHRPLGLVHFTQSNLTRNTIKGRRVVRRERGQFSAWLVSGFGEIWLVKLGWAILKRRDRMGNAIYTRTQ